GGANAAPLDFLGGYEVAYFEIAHVLANFCHSPGELVTEDVGEACKTGIEHVAVAAALVHMHVRSADTDGGDLNDYLVVFWSRVRRFANADAGVLPYLRAAFRFGRLALHLGKGVIGSWSPSGGKGPCFLLF